MSNGINDVGWEFALLKSDEHKEDYLICTCSMNYLFNSPSCNTI